MVTLPQPARISGPAEDEEITNMRQKTLVIVGDRSGCGNARSSLEQPRLGLSKEEKARCVSGDGVKPATCGRPKTRHFERAGCLVLV